MVKMADNIKQSQDYYVILNPASIYDCAEGFLPWKEFNQLKWQWLFQNDSTYVTVVSLFLNQEILES